MAYPPNNPNPLKNIHILVNNNNGKLIPYNIPWLTPWPPGTPHDYGWKKSMSPVDKNSQPGMALLSAPCWTSSMWSWARVPRWSPSTTRARPCSRWRLVAAWGLWDLVKLVGNLGRGPLGSTSSCRLYCSWICREICRTKTANTTLRWLLSLGKHLIFGLWPKEIEPLFEWQSLFALGLSFEANAAPGWVLDLSLVGGNFLFILL